MAKERSFFKKGDIIIIFSVIAAALLLFAWTRLGKSSKNAVAEVYVDGALYKTIDLAKVTEPYTLEIDAQLHVHLEVMPGSIRFTESECRDKICINTGKLSAPPDYAACLPARVAVKVVSAGSEPAIDGVTG